jgi:hypothetical protein
MPKITSGSFAAVMWFFPSPTTLNFSFPKAWDDSGSGWAGAFLAEGADTSGTVAAGKQMAINVAGNFGNLSKAHQKAYNYSVNPRASVTFSDLKFRGITLEWSLKPRTRTESILWDKAIKILKAQSAPNLSIDNTIFDVEHCFFDMTIKTSKGRNLFKSPSLVITDVSTNLTPQSFWSQHKDGYPTEIGLSIGFMETVLATKDKLESGEIV